MKDVKLSFPYPSTSRHNLSQDISTSLSMGVLVPVRVVEVLPGDSHRISTSFSLLSNPLVKPLLQGVRMRYCRFWVPRRIYHPAQRENDINYDPRTSPVRYGGFGAIQYPFVSHTVSGVKTMDQRSNYQSSSLFDYLGLANVESNFAYLGSSANLPETHQSALAYNVYFNAEPYIGYLDICRNYFADSANGMIAFYGRVETRLDPNLDGPIKKGVIVAPLSGLDNYIRNVQHTEGIVSPYDYTEPVTTDDAAGKFANPFVLKSFNSTPYEIPNFGKASNGYSFVSSQFGLSYCNLCVPVLRPDRLSRLFDTAPLVSQTATITPSEVSIGNLSFLAKFQRYITRRFFGGSRFTDVMYSVFGQKVPHVDTPKLLDVFDAEIGSELVSSTAAGENQNGDITTLASLGGYFRAAGILSSGRGSRSKRYTFNESGYIIDLVYIMPRVCRSAFVSDFYPVNAPLSQNLTGDYPMAQGNFIPDFNGIGWQQPSQTLWYFDVKNLSGSAGTLGVTRSKGFCCEPSFQQYRTLPDICSGLFNPNRSYSTFIGSSTNVDTFGPLVQPTLNTPLYIFTDRVHGYNAVGGLQVPGSSEISDDELAVRRLAGCMFMDPSCLNYVFGVDVDQLVHDNIFCVFRYAHQAKRQVTRRFVLNFN